MRVKVMKSNLARSLSSEAGKLEATPNRNQPVCPKPRRPAPSIPEVLRPFRCTRHRCSHQPNNDGKSVIPSVVDEKILCDGYEPGCTACSPACYVGSPPRRTDNPLIHDVQFIHQMELLPPLSSMRTKLSDNFSFSSPASPV